jgi:hypothetical protein
VGLFSLLLLGCGVAPKNGAPAITSNQVLIDVDTFEVWRNIDGEIIDLKLNQLITGVDFDMSSIYEYFDKQQFMNLMLMRFNNEGLHAKIVDDHYIKIWR